MDHNYRATSRSVIRLVGVLAFGVGAFLASMLPIPRNTGDIVQYGAPPIVSVTSTDEDIRRAALATVRNEFVIRSGTPKVLLVRRVNADDLPTLGLGSLDFAVVERPPLALAIIKGDFGPCSCPGLIPNDARSEMRARYVGYIFDLWYGGAFWMQTSGDGGVFRIALNDPSLPVVPTVPISPTHPPSFPPLHYGDVAPTVAIPTRGNGG